MTKYEIPDDHEWADEKERELEYQPVAVDSHTVDIIHTTDPAEDRGYGRDKYTVHITEGEDDSPYVLFAVKHRWKGNYWREWLEIDWRDLPHVVKRQVAHVVACDGVDALDAGHRLIEEGGQPVWQRRNDDVMEDDDD